MDRPKVVIHLDEAGDISVVADGDVSVFWVDERVPRDRIYQMEPGPIPDELLSGAIGHRNDGTPAATRAKVLEAHIEGKAHLSVVDTES